MDGFLLALMASFVLALGGRDQWLVAQWRDALGRTAPLLVLASACAALSVGAMAWLGAEFLAMLPLRARPMLVAAALALAAMELAVPVKRLPPREPTRSLGAIAIVLLARQPADAARLAVAALSIGTASPLGAGLGGAVGGAAALALGWSAGAARLARWPLGWLRRGLAVCLIVAALFIGLSARYAAL